MNVDEYRALLDMIVRLYLWVFRALASMIPESPDAETGEKIKAQYVDRLFTLVEQGRAAAWAASALYLEGESRKRTGLPAYIPDVPSYSRYAVEAAVRDAGGNITDPVVRNQIEVALVRHVETAARQTVKAASLPPADGAERREQDRLSAPRLLAAVEQLRSTPLGKDKGPLLLPGEESGSPGRYTPVGERAEVERRLLKDLDDRLDDVEQDVWDDSGVPDEYKPIKHRSGPHSSVNTIASVKTLREKEKELGETPQPTSQQLRKRTAQRPEYVRTGRPYGWARMVHPERGKGGPVCGFCATLASRGPVYHSKQSASAPRSHQSHLWEDYLDGGGAKPTAFHNHCRCTAVPVYNAKDYDGKEQADDFLSIYRDVRNNVPAKDVLAVMDKRLRGNRSDEKSAARRKRRDDGETDAATGGGESSPGDEK